MITEFWGAFDWSYKEYDIAFWTQALPNTLSALYT